MGKKSCFNEKEVLIMLKAFFFSCRHFVKEPVYLYSEMVTIGFRFVL